MMMYCKDCKNDFNFYSNEPPNNQWPSGCTYCKSKNITVIPYEPINEPKEKQDDKTK